MENIWIVQSKYLSHIILPVYYKLEPPKRCVDLKTHTESVCDVHNTTQYTSLLILYLSYIFLLCHIMYCWDYTCNAIMFQMTGVRVATNTLYTRAFYFPIKMI